MRMLKKIGSILKDESGAALVVTVSVFLFIYLAILGVYAIGMNVRNRIHIQNACDAAAYSAAVVQADALSRIATLNRAMSWTYCQMIKRQMDYVIHQWLDAACRRYQGDVDRCNSNGRRGCGGHLKWNWVGASESVGDRNKMNLFVNGELVNSSNYRNVQRICANFRDRHLRDTSSFYSPAARQTSGIERLQNQISDDKNNIQGFNNAISRIQRTLVGTATANAVSVWRANIPSYLDNGLTVPIVKMNDPSTYMRALHRDAEEVRFRRFVSHNQDDLRNCDFTPQGWFPSVRSENEKNPLGFRRRYTKSGLCAEWEWSWERWRCHNHRHPRTRWSKGTTRVKAEDVKDVYFSELDANKKPVIANPQVLTSAYFGANGTITVGIAVPNSNPFARIIGSVSGIFSAFNPGVAKTVCFSSAKAGYGRILGDANDNRRYSIDWDDEQQSWNLCQSDWDAVFVPVRRAGSKAEKGAWQGDVAPFLGDLVGRLGIGEDDFKAGKEVSSSQAKYVRYLQDDKEGIEGGPVRWRVKNPGAAVDWSGLHNRMFH